MAAGHEIENLSFLLKLRGKRIAREQILEVFSLLGLPLEERPIRYFSAGQKRRVALARLWLEESAIWILDEPFTALDIDSIALLEQKMKAHYQSGGGIIFTSHQAPVEEVVSKTLVIERFRVDA